LVQFRKLGPGFFVFRERGVDLVIVAVAYAEFLEDGVFDLCTDRRIRAIRLFQDPSGWTPHYTGTGADAAFQPVCFGPAYFAPPPGPTM
jgi:1,2-dihydroxy-3-keto-5-methylthiopentene dioxygenase